MNIRKHLKNTADNYRAEDDQHKRSQHFVCFKRKHLRQKKLNNCVWENEYLVVCTSRLQVTLFTNLRQAN